MYRTLYRLVLLLLAWLAPMWAQKVVLQGIRSSNHAGSLHALRRNAGGFYPFFNADGVRQGQVAATAGAPAPAFVAPSGTDASLLPDALVPINFGDLPLNTPAVRWLKVSQSVPSLTVIATEPSYRVVLVEDVGFGHGNPARSAFGSSVSASCFNCYLGVQFLPLSVGQHAGALTLASTASGNATTVNVTGYGLPLTGPVLSPSSQNFRTVPVHSSSASTTFTLTNGSAEALTVNNITFTGDFTTTSEITGGTVCGSGAVLPGAACLITVRFTAAASGVRSGTLSISTSAGSVLSTLTGTGSDDPGVAFSPGELRFDNVPDASAREQTVSVRNTSATSVVVGSPTVSNTHFAANTTCGVLPVDGTCDIHLLYTASSALASGILSVPVTSTLAGSSNTTQYAIALSGLYTSETAGLQIVPGEHTTVNFGAAGTGTQALTRVLHVNNLSGQQLVVTIDMPRQFALVASTCDVLPANSGCDLSVQYTPLTSGDTTCTVLVQGMPADNSVTQTALGYLQGYGLSSSDSLQITGNISPLGVLDFGQVNSGQTYTQTLTVTNPVMSQAIITVRRMRSEFPFLSSSNCGDPLAPGQSCQVTVTYAPKFQSAVGSSQTSTQVNTGTLSIESDGADAPQYINLSGSAQPVFVTAPDNTAPIAALTPSKGSLTFTSPAVGTASAPQVVTLTNTGTATVHITGLLTTNGFLASTSCAVLASGASCDISLQYVPQNPAAVLGALQIQSDSSTPLDFISLLGMPVAAQAPASIAVSPQLVDFGRVLVGATKRTQVTLANTGSTPVVLGASSISGNGSFALEAGNDVSACAAAGSTLPPGASCTLTIRFTPAITGTLRASLSVASSATSLPLTVALSGVGTQPQLAVSLTALRFGNVTVGSTSSQAVTLVNTSGLPVDGLRFAVSAGFSASTTCGITTINAASSCAVSVTFSPTATGSITGTLTISSTDPASPLILPLTGNGVQPAGGPSTSSLSLTPALLDFGTVPPGSSSTLTATLRNAGTTTVTNIVVSSTPSFAATTNCGSTLSSGSSCPITVTYTASTPGITTGLLSVTSSDATSPLTASLIASSTSGASGSFTLTVNNAASASTTVHAGLPATFALSVIPTSNFRGTANLTCTADQAVQYAACSLVPPSVTLAGSAQASTATVSTVTAVDLSASAAQSARLPLWCVAAPILALCVKRRRPAALVLALLSLCLLNSGCGSGGDPRVRYVAPGTYHFHVTATSSNGPTVSDSVALTVIVTPRD